MRAVPVTGAHLNLAKNTFMLMLARRRPIIMIQCQRVGKVRAKLKGEQGWISGCACRGRLP
jgi:hypothetical protein